MANSTVYPYGTGGSLPSSIGIINDLTTGGANNALSAEMGKVLNNKIKGQVEFLNNTDIDYAYDAATGANYTVIRIYRKKADGSLQFPFVYAPNGTATATKSALTVATEHGWMLTINGGVFSNKKPEGSLIQNGTIVQAGPGTTYPLTIDGDGNLSYAAINTTAAELIANGIVSAVCGFFPIIIDYDAVDPSFYTWSPNYNTDAQRQIIGQFGNGDYAIVTCEGRGYDHSDGWTIEEAITICQKLGLKFAYNLDGGGSAETMLGTKPFNTIYENTTGRIVPTFIVFNGLSTFSIPD